MKVFFRRLVGGLALAALMHGTTAGADPADDPLGSANWNYMRKQFLDGKTVVFDNQVKLIGPKTAEDSMQVPVTVDASALSDVREVLVFADYNPIQQVLRFYPGSAKPFLGFRMKLQQSSPVRAAVQTADGVWHLGGQWIEAVGGGCTAPSVGSASPEWQSRLNEVSGRQWTEGPNAGRLRLRIVHPMDTGLVASIPAFHLQEIRFSDEAGQLLMRVEPFEPVSENPVFTLQRRDAGGAIEASGRDNNGNVFRARIAP